MSENHSQPSSKPKFLWGAATAAHQVEGNTQNDWTAWEVANAEALSKKAVKFYTKANPRFEEFRHLASQPENYISGNSVDHYNRFEEDIDILAGLGLNSYRFSIEWARIEPREGEFNEEAIEHYRQVLKKLKKENIEPFVTLHHFTNPQWFVQKGGLAKPENQRYFVRYAERMATEYKGLVKFWITFNEPLPYVLMRYLKAPVWPDWPSQELAPIKAFKAIRTIINSHKAARIRMKAIDPGNQVAIAKHMIHMLRSSLLSKLMAPIAEYSFNLWLLNRLKSHQDFIAVQYYISITLEPGFKSPQKWANMSHTKALSDMGWALYPEGFSYVLKQAKRYNLPVYVTENGIADSTDELRADFIKTHVAAMREAMAAGVDVRGYFYWSLLDNYEWSAGVWPEFGLIKVDRATQKRTIRPSAQVYASIIKKNNRHESPTIS